MVTARGVGITIEHDTAFHRVRITDNDGIRMMRFERNRQSSMYLDDPFETDIEYVGYLHLPLAICPEPTRALLIGLGGGSLAKRMWRDYPQLHVDVVEIDAEIIEVARAYFAVPDDPRLELHCQDGRHFVRFAPDLYDLVIIDAFDDDRIPLPLVTEEFLLDVRDCLKPGGVIAYNFIGSIYGQHSKPFRSLHRTLGNIWRRRWVFPLGYGEDPTDKSRNIAVMATDTDLSAEEMQERIASRVDGRVSVPKFDRFGEDMYLGPIRTGDVPILTERPARRPSSRKR